MDSKVVNSLYKKLSKQLGAAESEIRYKNHFELLIAVILSAQSTDKTVNLVTNDLFSICSTPESILLLGQKKLQKIIRPVGLSPTKSKNIISTCKILLENHDGEIPDNREALELLPGVGRKTANLVLIVALRSQSNICVDTHVHRISNRLGWVSTRTPEETELALYEVASQRWWPLINQYLVTWGQNVCKPRYPLCRRCAVEELCPRLDVAQVGK